MNSNLYYSFLVTSLIVLAVPGPSFAYAVAVGARATRQEIAFNAVGMGLGGLAITMALAFGASQLLSASPLAYAMLEVAGCAYLVYLGVVTFFASAPMPAAQNNLAARRGIARSAIQGFVVETANPKSILFYAALVPQFVDPSTGGIQLQFLVLGVTFVALQVAWDITLMFGVSYLRSGVVTFMSSKVQRMINRMSGTIFMVLGVALLFQERPAPISGR